MKWSKGTLRVGTEIFCFCSSSIQVNDRFHRLFNFSKLHDMVKQCLLLLKVAVEGAFQLFDFQGNEMIISKVGVSDGVFAEHVFEKRDGFVIKNEVGEFMGGERDVGG